MEYVTLNNGVKMPKLGYGVYQVAPGECERCVLDALSVGYRSIDTAQVYDNEEGVGSAVKKSGIARGELFLTTKVWISNAGEKRAAASIDASLKKLGTDYVDLLLIHQPFGDYYVREGLSFRERELVTFCFLAAQGGCEAQLAGHVAGNFQVGNDAAYLGGAVLCILPWIGYPRSLIALACVRNSMKKV